MVYHSPKTLASVPYPERIESFYIFTISPLDSKYLIYFKQRLHKNIVQEFLVSSIRTAYHDYLNLNLYHLIVLAIWSERRSLQTLR
jgi:hypothetical protein